MAKYRKKPIVVEATQWHGFEKGPHDLDVMLLGSDKYGWINTLGGNKNVEPGDWIITSNNGGRYICRPDIFEATYEPVEED